MNYFLYTILFAFLSFFHYFCSMNYKNIIFDLGNVLVKLDEKACMKAFEQLGLKDTEHIKDNQEVMKLFRDFGLGYVSNQVFFDEFRRIARSKASNKQITDAANKMLLYIPDEKKQVLLYLRQTGHQVYLLSNTNDIHWRYCADVLFPMQEHSVEDYFDGIFLSQELHLEKPDDRIFQTMIETTGINPQESLFIDDLEKNCMAGERNGLHTFQNQDFNDWLALFHTTNMSPFSSEILAK